MSWPTSRDDLPIRLALSHLDLRHIISALVYMNNDQTMSLETADRNGMLIELLLQIDVDETDKVNQEKGFDGWEL